MTTSIALAQILIGLLPKIEVGITEIINFISGVRRAAQQTGEWTDEQDASFRQALIDSGRDPKYAME